MTPQSALYFLLLSAVMIMIRLRKSAASRMTDILVFALCLLVLVVGAGHLFNASRFYTITSVSRISPQTLVCMMLLAYVVVLRRAEYGIFSILLGVGIGSKIVRIACPFALLLPFLLEMVRSAIIEHGLLSLPYATAITTSLAAMVGFGLILILAWRIDALEKAIRTLSLRDELTNAYNRRGFYVLAEQALRLAQRSKSPFSVLFIDLDDLKLINDTLGHDAGSSLLVELAVLLKKSFRKSDVIGRLGGDEFAVAAEAGEIALMVAVHRLEAATADWNSKSGHRYSLSFSYGHVTSDINHEESLDDLLSKADQLMYQTKRRKKMERASSLNQPNLFK